MRVDVYYNLHKHKLSVRSRERANYGRVVKHADTVFLGDVKFVVGEAGRKRVLKEKRKNVHAFVRGNTRKDFQREAPCDCWECDYLVMYHNCLPHGSYKKVTYNPYLYDSFVLEDTKEPVTKAKFCIVRGKQILALNPT